MNDDYHDIHVIFMVDKCRKINLEDNSRGKWKDFKRSDLWQKKCLGGRIELPLRVDKSDRYFTDNDMGALVINFSSVLIMASGDTGQFCKKSKKNMNGGKYFLLLLKDEAIESIHCVNYGGDLNDWPVSKYSWDKYLKNCIWSGKDGVSMFVENLEIHGIWGAWGCGIKDNGAIPVYKSTTLFPFLPVHKENDDMEAMDTGSEVPPEEGVMDTAARIKNKDARGYAFRALSVKEGDTRGGRLAEKFVPLLVRLENLPCLLDDEKKEMKAILAVLPELAESAEAEVKDEAKKLEEAQREDIRTDIEMFHKLMELDQSLSANGKTFP